MARFPDSKRYFEQPSPSDKRPPVFVKLLADWNVLIEPGISSEKTKHILAEIPALSRHRWFRSMASSQALAQSIFGNLKVNARLHSLNDLLDDAGNPLFGRADLTAQNLTMEYTNGFLGEPTPTSVDVFFSGGHQIAIECKLAEREVGSCSRPRLEKTSSKYEKEYCDGSYMVQRGREHRCSLTERGILYWKYVPELFEWQNDTDHRNCPLNRNYQLVRNILAACMHSDGNFSAERGHVVLIYDERNPKFQSEGKGFKAFNETRAALKDPMLLRSCSWQRVLDHLRGKGHLPWLTNEIKLKYGL